MNKYDFFFDSTGGETIVIPATSLDEAKEDLKKFCKDYALFRINMTKTFDGIIEKARKETKSQLIGIEWVKLSGEVRRAQTNPLHVIPPNPNARKRQREKDPDLFVFPETRNKVTKEPRYVSLYKESVRYIKTRGQKINF